MWSSDDGTPVGLLDLLRSNSEGDAGSTQMRQPAMCESKASFPWHSKGQFDGCLEQRKAETDPAKAGRVESQLGVVGQKGY